jgi:MFS family permease
MLIFFLSPLRSFAADEEVLRLNLFSWQIGSRSALCSAAQNMTWLIVCRAIQGIGGGGITPDHHVEPRECVTASQSLFAIDLCGQILMAVVENMVG